MIKNLKFKAYIKEYGTVHDVDIINFDDELVILNRPYGETAFCLMR